nr:hypothetical protein [Candidatus Cloacimonadota bacterium]
MNTRSYLVLIVAMLIFSLASVQLAGSAWGYGLEGGIAKGDNTADTDDENRVPAVRGNMQLTLYEQLHIRFGLGYTPLKADDVYDAKLVQADVRLLFRPIQMNLLSPYLYAGIGAAKDVGDSSTDIFPVVPFGFGFQTRFSPKFLIDLSAGYNLALSDEMDGRDRPDNQTNRYTNKKQDGNFTVMLGVEFTKPYQNKHKNDKSDTVREKKPVANPSTTDTDKDGLTDIDETNEYRTDPLKMDTDNDGLTDGEEVLKYSTNPLQADSDNDGLTDGMEINQFKTNPLKADSDNDGLTDYSEIHTHLSNPLSIDSDGGGMNDGAEVKAGKNPLDSKDDGPKSAEPAVVTPKSDTSQKDTDGDGLTDIDEQQRYRTDINKRDTDGDGLYDGEEVYQY